MKAHLSWFLSERLVFLVQSLLQNEFYIRSGNALIIARQRWHEALQSSHDVAISPRCSIMLHVSPRAFLCQCSFNDYMTRVFEAEVNLMLSLHLIIINLVALVWNWCRWLLHFSHVRPRCWRVEELRRCWGWQGAAPRAVTLSTFISVLGETYIWSFTVACDLKRRCVVFPSCFHLLSHFSHSLTCNGGNSHQASHQICLILPKSCKAHGVNGFCPFLPITSSRKIFLPRKTPQCCLKPFS